MSEELSRARQRRLRRLTDRKGRVQEGLVLVEGPRAVRAALASGARFRFVLLEEGLRGPGIGELIDALAAAGVETVRAGGEELAAFADTETPQGVLGVAQEPTHELPAEALGERVLVLDAVQDPGNVGTLIRTAAAFGLSRVIALDGTVDPWNAKAVRASTGLAFRLPVHRLGADETLGWLARVGLPLLVADAEGRDVRAGALPRREAGGFALAVGNEGAGPRPQVRKKAARLVSLPLAPGVDSLNAAMAGSILLWVLGPGTDPPEGAPDRVPSSSRDPE
jgi:RNA methyltransferase, TrmH family